ncbi:MAG: NAD-dependent epimerase/dehydratase family protein [Thermoleophilaceae bacterium]
MGSKRILVTGLSTYWGGRLAQALEQDPEIEVIIGVDSEDPTRELERTEFVRVGTQHALLRRIVEAAEIDTVVDTRLVVESASTSARLAHENNVIGTMNILAACSGPQCRVNKLVFKSSAHFYGTAQDDPAFFTEGMGRPHPPATPIERDILDAEAAVNEFAEHNPDTTVTTLRCTNVLGPSVKTSHTALFRLPAVPMILGFDPRYQFVHEDDVVAALAHALREDLPGVYNVGADGILSLSEVIGLLGKPYAPILPPWGTGLAATVLRRAGLRIPPEMLSQLRFGRGLDNRKLKSTGFGYRYTSRETVLKLAEHLRLEPILRGARESYTYEHDVEEFLRWSPHVRTADRGRRTAEPAAPPEPEAIEVPIGEPDPPAAVPDTRDPTPETPAEPPVEHYDDLDAEEIISLLGSLEASDLEALRDYEGENRAREGVVGAIEAVLSRRAMGSRP